VGLAALILGELIKLIVSG